MSIKRKGYEKDKRAAGDKGDKGLGGGWAMGGLWRGETLVVLSETE